MKDTANAEQALNQTLQTTPTGKLLASQPSTQEALQSMAQNGYLPDTSTGVNDFSASLKKNADSRKTLSDDVASVLDVGGEQGSLDEAKKNAYANIEKYSPIREQAQQKAVVDKEIETYRQKFGDNTSLGNIERIKREQGGAAGDWQKDTPTRAAHKALYGGLRTTVTNNTKHKDLYERVMKEETKSFKMDKLMKKMQGKKALEHKGVLRDVLKSYGKYVGTYLGDRIGGPIGAIVGTMVGDHLTRAVDKRFGKTYFESKEGRKLLELVSHKSPAMAKVLKKELQKYGVKAEALKKEANERVKKGLLLGSGAIPMGAKTSKPELAKVLQATKNPVSSNPKTKKFQTSYNSAGIPKEELAKKLGGLFKGEVSQNKRKKK